MSNDALQHVTEVQQRGDNSIVVYLQAYGFNPGQEVEVSVYITQDDAYIAYNDKKRIPLPDPKDAKQYDPSNSEQPVKLHVELPRTELDVAKPVTAITRVAEVWPTVVQPDPDKLEEYQGIVSEYAGQGLKAVWTPEGKGAGASQSPSTGN